MIQVIEELQSKQDIEIEIESVVELIKREWGLTA